MSVLSELDGKELVFPPQLDNVERVAYKMGYIQCQLDIAMRDLKKIQTDRVDNVVKLSIDGDSACALLGENLQEGEAEFVRLADTSEFWRKVGIEQSVLTQQFIERQSCIAAFSKLNDRLGDCELVADWTWFKENRKGYDTSAY